MRILLFLLLFISGTSFGQNEALQSFSVQKIDDEIHLSWTIKSGYTCQGISILRSSDSLFFEEIGEISGVCGSLSEPQSYRFVDDVPILNQMNFYQLELGENGPSGIMSIEFIALGSDGILIYPNPASETFQFVHDNPTRSSYLLYIINPSGQVIESIETRAKSVLFNSNRWESGIYHLVAVDSETKEQTSSKIAIQH